ncbi:hypothetical protein HXY33_07350 [Candidatus Bathyarchaeota archaeon]|nr:hypothetical protein [Candidatus Bathyarchaeota archaeon]
MSKYRKAPRTCRVKVGAFQNQLVPPPKCDPATNHANIKSTTGSMIMPILGVSLTICESKVKVTYIGRLAAKTNKVNPRGMPQFSMKILV